MVSEPSRELVPQSDSLFQGNIAPFPLSLCPVDLLGQV
jgi:hypothetical protein